MNVNEGKDRAPAAGRACKASLFATRNLVIMAVLVAVQVVLSRFASITAWNVKIGFGFVPVMLGGMLLGPLGGGIIGMVSDLIGSILFPSGAFFPGFTLTAFLTGVIFGLFLQKKPDLPRLACAVVLNQLLCSLLLNTLWISILYGSSYLGLLSTRILQAIFYVVVQIGVGLLLVKVPIRKLAYG